MTDAIALSIPRSVLAWLRGTLSGRAATAAMPKRRSLPAKTEIAVALDIRF
jgi:hypothetical protein